jgi:hypothetical protein
MSGSKERTAGMVGFQRQYKLAFPLLFALTLGSDIRQRAERLPIKSYTTGDGLRYVR